MFDDRLTRDAMTVFGRWRWRVAQRPTVWFLAAWLGLAGLFLAMQLAFGVPWGALHPEPPPAEAIDYARYMPGGARAADPPLATPRDALPRHDSALSIQSVTVATIAKGDTSQLIVRRGKLAHIGWPIVVGRISRSTAFDVTDPRQPFKSMPGRFEAGSMRVRHIDGQAIHLTRDRSGYFSITLEARRLTAILAALAGFALMPVAFGLWTRWSVARRVRCGRCVCCAHQLGPPPRPGRCPECGALVVERSPFTRQVKSWARPPWVSLFFAMWLLLSGVALVLSIAWADDHRPRDLSRQLAQLREFPSFQVPALQPSRRVELGRRDYGWPNAAVIAHYGQWFELDESGRLTPTDANLGVRIRSHMVGSRRSWVWIARQEPGEPSRATWYRVNPWMIATYLLLLQLIALALTAGAMMTARLIRWHRNQVGRAA